MIYKIVKGRLGNQMFQYAAMRKIQLENYREELLFNFKYVESKGSPEDGFTNTLKDFCAGNNFLEERNKMQLSLIQKMKLFITAFFLAILKKIIRKSDDYAKKRRLFEIKIQKWLNKSGIYWMTDGYYNFDFSVNKEKNKVFYGYFESKEFFKSIKDELRKDFCPNKKRIRKNQRLYDIIEKSNSICVSIRRGDFVTNPEYKKKHFICDKEYFENAINIMKEKIDKPVFVFFSDDIEWVKNNINIPEGCSYFEDGDDPVWEKLRLMYSCKNFILSNSSFSWWAQFLCENKMKLVIAPQIWRKNEENPDIYEDSWILI